MEHDAPAIFVALEQSGFAAAIRQSVWIYPLANVGHIISLVAFAGSFGVPAWRVERAAELAPAMRAAVAESGPTLVAISAPVGQPW